MKRIFIALVWVSLSLFLAPEVRAEAPNQFITIVNPVREAYYTKDIAKNIETQYGIIKNENLTATWLLTYDVLTDQKAIIPIQSMDKMQETGIFLEVTPNLAAAAGIEYHSTGSWHFANAVFLSGYTQNERKKLIDAVFAKFKEVFGNYPTSVGSWWTDSFALSYMKEKYGITANLTCSDQFSTDGYEIWGTPWSTAFYPSKYNTGIPASDASVKLDLVNLEWAPRDPVNGYKNSLYSTQDYKVVGQSFDFFKKLVGLYGRTNGNKFGQITIGLEGDLDPNAYNGEFKKQTDYVKSLVDSGEFKTLTMNEFSSWYRQNFPDLSPASLISTDDFLGSGRKVIWYQSPKYRIGILFDSEGKNAKVFDLRIYQKDMEEPYFASPNRSNNLSINIPSIFDEVMNPDDIWELEVSGGRIHFYPDKIVIDKFFWDIPKIISKSNPLTIKRSVDEFEIDIEDKGLLSPRGVEVKDLSVEATHFFKSKRFLLDLLLGRGWNYFKKVSYLIPQGETDALFHLSVLPPGGVLVYNHECLQCEWHSEFPPPAFANKRNYVRELGKHPIVYNSSVFEATSRQNAKNEVRKLGIKYVYLVKFEGYSEKLPFSPGDLGVREVYSNANAEIWEVTK